MQEIMLTISIGLGTALIIAGIILLICKIADKYNMRDKIEEIADVILIIIMSIISLVTVLGVLGMILYAIGSVVSSVL